VLPCFDGEENYGNAPGEGRTARDVGPNNEHHSPPEGSDIGQPTCKPKCSHEQTDSEEAGPVAGHCDQQRQYANIRAALKRLHSPLCGRAAGSKRIDGKRYI